MKILDTEDFYRWAKANRDEYIEFYSDRLEEVLEENDLLISAEDLMKEMKADLLEVEDVYGDAIVQAIESAEDDDYFGTEGFNKRFA